MRDALYRRYGNTRILPVIYVDNFGLKKDGSAVTE